MKLIAETAWHHEGDFSFMKNLIHEITTKTDVDLVKMHITLDFDSYMDSKHELYSDLKSMLFSKNQWKELIKIVQDSNKGLMLLTNDAAAVEFVAPFEPEIVELHSTCLNVPHLQTSILNNLQEDVKVVIGVGGCTLEEIENAVQTFQKRQTILMFGFQNYPTKYEDVNISKIKKIQSLYPKKFFGYADHTAWNEPNNELITLLVATHSMDFIEKHVTNAFGQKRIDSSAAISIDMCNNLSKRIKLLKKLNGNGSTDLNEGEQSYSTYGPMKLAALAKSDLKSGHIISFDDIYFKRTNEKTDLSQLDIIKLIGKSINISIYKNEILKSSHFKKIL
tara:strand:+ start:14 stop:1018 length:1005 start_codon:yes stop_codon:yes gene_type:complete